MLAVFSWQALAVRYNYAGNWTGLFCIGSLPQPPALGETLWRFPNSSGYDGQWYHLIAHDPWRKRGFDRYIDSPRIRYHRILLPVLAHLVAAGRDGLVDGAYVLLVLAAIGLGVWWLSRYVAHYGITPWLGAAFLLAPAALVSIDRLTVDIVIACLCVGFVYFRATNDGWPLYLVLLAAPLVHDTGFVLVAGYAAGLFLEGRYRRGAVFASAALPGAIWYRLVALSTAPEPTVWMSPWPLAGYVHALLHPFRYPFPLPVTILATALDYLALVGMALALVGAAVLLLNGRGKSPGWWQIDPGAVAILSFAGLAVFLNRTDVWTEAYGFGRILTPLLVLLATAAIPQRRWALAIPLLLVTPRVALQFAPQAIHIVRGML